MDILMRVAIEVPELIRLGKYAALLGSKVSQIDPNLLLSAEHEVDLNCYIAICIMSSFVTYFYPTTSPKFLLYKYCPGNLLKFFQVAVLST